MRSTLALALTLLIATTIGAQDARVDRILREVPLIDGHNDLPWEYRDRVKNHLAQLDIRQDQSHLAKPLHTDIARLKAGHVGGQFWSVYVPVTLKGADALQATLEQIDVVHRLCATYPEALELALTADDVVRIHKSGRVASMIGVEGGHSINNSLAALRMLYRAGARYMTLTHSSNNDWADSATDNPQAGGLTEFGKAVVGEMNRLGMLVDLSHVSPATMHDALDVAAAPVIFSHSSARAITDVPRNVPDDILARVKTNGGVVMVTFVAAFVSPEIAKASAPAYAEFKRRSAGVTDVAEVDRIMREEFAKVNAPKATLAQVADHIEHVRKVAGADHVGLGGDYDGNDNWPVGLEDVSKYPDLFAELVRRGWSDEDLKKLASGNILRVMREAEAAARRLQAARPPSTATIEGLDGAAPAAAK